jgi:hypothetical protein
MLFFQRFVAGPLVGYGAVRSRDRTVAEFAATEMKGRGNPLGLTAAVATIEDDALVTLGRRILDGLGCQGLAAIEFLLDADGRLWMIDLSTRAWGNFLSLTGAGVDFAKVYVDVLRNPYTSALSQQTEPGRVIRVVPAAITNDARELSLPRLMTALVGDLRPYAGRLGLSYCGVVVAGVLRYWGQLRLLSLSAAIRRVPRRAMNRIGFRFRARRRARSNVPVR